MSIEEMKADIVYNYGWESPQANEFFDYCEQHRGQVDFDPVALYQQLMNE